MKTLIVIDMQADFVTGALGTPEAVAILPNVKKKIEEYLANGNEVIFTRDTHNVYALCDCTDLEWQSSQYLQSV